MRRNRVFEWNGVFGWFCCVNCYDEVNGFRFDRVMNSEGGLMVDVMVRKVVVERFSGERGGVGKLLIFFFWVWFDF